MKDMIEKYDIKRKLLNEWINQQYRLQQELMEEIIRDGNDLGGLLGPVQGENGTYEVESIYLDNECDKIMCHLDFRAFETDACFEDFSVSERQQMIELAIKLLTELNSKVDK